MEYVRYVSNSAGGYYTIRLEVLSDGSGVLSTDIPLVGMPDRMILSVQEVQDILREWGSAESNTAG